MDLYQYNKKVPDAWYKSLLLYKEGLQKNVGLEIARN